MAIPLVKKKVLFSFFVITSIENKIPAIGLPNKTVIPAVIPVQINSVLYFLKIVSFSGTTLPIAAVATTVET